MISNSIQQMKGQITPNMTYTSVCLYIHIVWIAYATCIKLAIWNSLQRLRCTLKLLVWQLLNKDEMSARPLNVHIKLTETNRTGFNSDDFVCRQFYFFWPELQTCFGQGKGNTNALHARISVARFIYDVKVKLLKWLLKLLICWHIGLLYVKIY